MAWVSITHCLWQDQSNKNKNMESKQFFWSFFISIFRVLSVWIKPGSKTLTVLLTRLRQCLRGKPHCMYNETKVQIQTNTKYKYNYKTNTKYKYKTNTKYKYNYKTRTKYKVIYSLSYQTAALLKRNPDCSMKWRSIPYIISYRQ